MKNEPDAEKRRHARYKIEKDAFAALKNGKTRVGKIADICLGGLALNYMEDVAIDQERGHVDIFTAGKNYYITDIPIRVIYDLQSQEARETFSFTAMNRCGIAFERLTETQSLQLTAFLNDCSVSCCRSNSVSSE